MRKMTKKSMMISNDPLKEIELTMKVRDALEQYRKDSHMDEKNWMRFCRRYATRDVSTITEMLSENYEKLPKYAAAIVRKELERNMVLDSICQQYRDK